MAAYEYQVLDAAGRKQRGVAQGDSPRQVRQALREQGLIPLEVQPVAERSTQGFARSGLSGSELSLVLRQLSTLVGAAIPLEEALAASMEQTDKRNVRRLLAQLRSQVTEGRSLAQSMESQPGAFPGWVSAAVAAGEQAGELATVLEKLADYAESRESLFKTIGMTLLYPLLIVIVAIAVVIAMMVYVVPRVVRVFDQVGEQLPLLTRILIAASDWLQANGLWLLLALLAAVVITVAVLRSGLSGGWHATLIRTPLLGRLLKTLNSARFTRTLSVLVSSAVPLLEALPIATNSLTNLAMREAAVQATREVREGVPLSQALGASGLFPPMALRLIASGESSGRLDQMLERAAVSHERDLDLAVQGFLGILQPLLILLVGGFVLLIVLAIMLPILNFNQLIS